MYIFLYNLFIFCRSSFTTTAQVFYKMISVDSDNGDTETANDNNNNIPLPKNAEIHSKEQPSDSLPPNAMSKPIESTILEDNVNINQKCVSSDSDPETFKPVQSLGNSSENLGNQERSHHVCCSTPIKSSDRALNLKRKHNESIDSSRMSNRVRTWLNRCSSYSTPQQRRPSPRDPSDVAQNLGAEDVSSCDASCECTSSSSDEANVYSSMSSSFCEDDVFRLKARVDGSVETVVHAILDSDYCFLLPPPPSSNNSFGSNPKNYKSRKYGRGTKAVSDGDLIKRRSLKEISK